VVSYTTRNSNMEGIRRRIEHDLYVGSVVNFISLLGRLHLALATDVETFSYDSYEVHRFVSRCQPCLVRQWMHNG
jgi:hypothetical protein